MGSVIPDNTAWGKALRDAEREWARVSNGKVKLQILPDSRAGDEYQMIQKMDNGTLDAAVLSSFGLNAITKKNRNVVTNRASTPSTAIITLSCPFLIQDEEELDIVLKGIKPDLEAKIKEKGYFPLAWSRVGWIKLFSKTPVRKPDDLRKLSLGSGTGEEEIKSVFERLGFKLRLKEQKDLLTGLTTNDIQAVYQSPIAVLGAQIVGVAPNMTNLLISPFMGGIVFSQKSWDAIPVEYRQKLIDVTAKIADRLDGAIKQLEADSIEQARKALKGKFNVIELSDAEKQAWYSTIDDALTGKEGQTGLIGTVFDKAIYDKVKGIVTAYRQGQGAQRR
jgi:TRAP-type C4-dicarboxylate transport system substrate-binding protein